ncbi:hypothetical protein AOLI_G00319600 [Acnodon oligacanthus]
MCPFTAYIFLPVAVGVAVVGGLTVVSGRNARTKCDNIQQEAKKLLEGREEAVKTFNTTAVKVTSHLNVICRDVEKILNFQKEKCSFLPKKKMYVRELGGDLQKLAALLEPKDLWRLLVQVEITLARKNIYQFDSLLPLMLEENISLGDFDKLKKRFRIQENELKSEAGWSFWKMKETIMQLQNTLDEMAKAKSEIERVIIPMSAYRISELYYYEDNYARTPHQLHWEIPKWSQPVTWPGQDELN